MHFLCGRTLAEDMLRQRLQSAAILLPLFLATALAGDPWYTLAAAIVAALAYLEFHAMMSRAGLAPLRLAGLVLSLLFIANAYLMARGLGDNTTLVLATAALVPLVLLLARPAQEGAAEAWALTLGGSLYAGWLLSLFILLRNLPQGLSWVLLAVLSTFACDSAAYLVGKALGRHKMVPHLSPGKTWEGAAGGLLAAIASAALLTLVFNTYVPGLQIALALPQALLLGLLIGILGQLGDLSESLLKRSVRAKDAGGLIPGHGGLLDRLDSLLFTGPATYFFARWLLA